MHSTQLPRASFGALILALIGLALRLPGLASAQAAAPDSKRLIHYHVEYKAPLEWQIDERLRALGTDGFAALEPYTGPGLYPYQICALLANQYPERYGDFPKISLYNLEESNSTGDLACYVLPDVPSPTLEGVLILKTPLGGPRDFLQLRTDSLHLEQIVQSIRLHAPVVQEPEKAYSSVGAGGVAPAEASATYAVMGLTVTEYPIVSAAVDNPGGSSDFYQRMPKGLFPAKPSPTFADEAARANLVLNRYGYNLTSGSELVKGDQILISKVSDDFSLTENASKTDFIFSSSGAAGDRDIALKDRTVVWTDEEHHFAPFYLGDRLVWDQAKGTYRQIQIIMDDALVAGLTMTPFFTTDPVTNLFAAGDSWILEMRGDLVYRDGQALNLELGYDGIFNARYLNQKLIFFYEKDGVAGLWYDGNELPVTYEKIPHGFCCGVMMYNPGIFEEGARFLALKDGFWYLVEVTFPR